MLGRGSPAPACWGVGNTGHGSPAGEDLGRSSTEGSRWWTRRRAASARARGPARRRARRPAAAKADLAGLLGRSARGDEAAFAELYDATSARVYGLALRVVRDPAQAQEVTQEAYLEIWRTARRFDPAKGSAISWLMTITHRKAVDRVRSAEAASRRDTAYHEANQRSTTTRPPRPRGSFEARRVRTALAGLTEVQREAISLAYFGGYTHTEVATHARPAGRHGQDPHPGRTDPVARRTGSGR